MVAELLGALALILCIGVGVRERSRWIPTIERRVFRRRLALEARLIVAEQELRRHSASLDTLFDRADASALAHADHVLSWHPSEPKRKAPVKAVPVKAAAKKATPQRSVR